jgi:streptomycin 6-kinase
VTVIECSGTGGTFEVPANLARSTAADTEHGEERRAWLAELPMVVAEVCARWSLSVERPFQPGGVTSWVAPARIANGHAAVLKVGWLHDEALHEAAGLQLWDGRACARVLNAWGSGATSALLLERCDPGTALAHAMTPSDQDVVIAGLLRRLWIEPPSGHPLRPLETMCLQWTAGFEKRYTAARVRGDELLDPGIIRTGLDLFRLLPTTSTRSVLLSTDLHAGNVLAAQREPWLVIDPKPYVGDPTYDPLQHMLNCPDRLATDPLGFVRRMADLLALDADRLRHWLFARCVQESIESPTLRTTAVLIAP